MSLKISHLLLFLRQLIDVCTSGAQRAQKGISFDYWLILIVLGQSWGHQAILTMGIAYDQLAPRLPEDRLLQRNQNFLPLYMTAELLIHRNVRVFEFRVVSELAFVTFE